MSTQWGRSGKTNRKIRATRAMHKASAFILLALFIGASLFAGQALAEKSYSRVETFKGLKIGIPNETWYGEYLNGFKTIELYKEKYHRVGDPTVRVFIDELPIADSILAAKTFSSESECEDITLRAGDFELCGFRETYEHKGTNVMDKLFWSIGGGRTLRFQVFVETNGTRGLPADDPEVLSIIENAIRLNGFDVVEEEAPVEIADADRHSLSSPVVFPADSFAATGFAVPVPEGWRAKLSDFNKSSVTLTRGDGEYGETPSVTIIYDDDEDVAALRAQAMMFSDEYRDILVEIDGREAVAIEGTDRMASKPVYWTYDYIFLPVEPAGSLYIKVGVESSEFEPCPLEDPDIQAIVTGIRLD